MSFLSSCIFLFQSVYIPEKLNAGKSVINVDSILDERKRQLYFSTKMLVTKGKTAAPAFPFCLFCLWSPSPLYDTVFSVLQCRAKIIGIHSSTGACTRIQSRGVGEIPPPHEFAQRGGGIFRANLGGKPLWKFNVG